MRRLLIALILSLTASLVFAQDKRFTDTDWNTTFVDSCGMPRPTSVERVAIRGDNKVRFTLFPGDIGKCSPDNRARHSAPYWERAELSQNTSLPLGTRHRISAEITFLRGFTGDRETFFQIHGWARNCQRAYPPVMLKFRKGLLRLETLQGATNSYRGNHRNVLHRQINVTSMYNRPSRLVVDFDTTTRPATLSLSLNGQQIITGTPVDMAPCAVPHIKFGIYRAGGKGVESSVLLYDDLKVQRME